MANATAKIEIPEVAIREAIVVLKLAWNEIECYDATAHAAGKCLDKRIVNLIAVLESARNQ